MDWRLQSACKLQAGGDAIAAAGFPVEGWLKTSVPSTVLAAQAAAGVVPDPYFGDNLRQIPGTDYPIGQNFSNLPMPRGQSVSLRLVVSQGVHCARAAAEQEQRFWLHFGGINYRADVWLNGHKIADTCNSGRSLSHLRLRCDRVY